LEPTLNDAASSMEAARPAASLVERTAALPYRRRS
jgi:hypothetical protein